jgi:hypothetical protein
LRNVSSGALRDVRESWPDCLDLEGFTYQRLGKHETDERVDRPQGWMEASLGTLETALRTFPFDCNRPAHAEHLEAHEFIVWLAKHQDLSPQPYAQLAAVLQRSGHPQQAKQVLLAGREREWCETRDVGKKVWLTLKGAITRYDVYPEFAGVWAIVLVLLGAVIFRSDRALPMRDTNFWGSLAYSLDMLLPAVELRPKHYEIDLISPFPRVYLYFHKLMGYVLITFLVFAVIGEGPLFK